MDNSVPRFDIRLAANSMQVEFRWTQPVAPRLTRKISREVLSRFVGSLASPGLVDQIKATIYQFLGALVARGEIVWFAGEWRFRDHSDDFKEGELLRISEHCESWTPEEYDSFGALGYRNPSDREQATHDEGTPAIFLGWKKDDDHALVYLDDAPRIVKGLCLEADEDYKKRIAGVRECEVIPIPEWLIRS